MSLENTPSFLLNFSTADMNGTEKKIYRFKSFRLDSAERQLLKDGKAISLTPKAFDVLTLLVRRAGHLVEKEELMREVWADSFVEEANLPRIIHTLRKALGKDENGNKFIETVAKSGYRFVVKVDHANEFAAALGNGNGSDSRKVALPFENSRRLQRLASEQTELPLGPAGRTMNRTALALTSAIAALLLFLFLVPILRIQFPGQTGSVKSIAILPLRSLIPENRDSVYEIGIANSLIRRIGSANGLEVRPLSVTQGYVDKVADPLTVGREQEVDYVLDTSYQIADGRIRVTSQLINVASGLIDADFQDEQITSTIFAVQDQIAANIGHHLLKKLDLPLRNRSLEYHTSNEEAYRYYWLGRALIEKHNFADSEKAIAYLEQAIALDSNYALAYAAMASAHGTMAMSGGDKREHYIEQRAAIEKALAIDENLPEAHSQLGMIKMTQDWDYDGAEVALRRALELDPGSAIGHRAYALYLNSTGRFDESIGAIKTALRFEPASVLNHRTYGMILYYARRYHEATAQLERTVELDPNFRGAYGFLCRSYRMNGENDKAFECFMRSPGRKEEDGVKIESWRSIYERKGWPGVLRQQINDAKVDENSSKLSPWDLTNLYGELGERDLAFACIEKGMTRGGWGWTVTKVNPSLDSLRTDPRYPGLLRRIGLE